MHKKTIWDLNRDDIDTFRNKDKMPLALIADNIRSLNNVGSLLRTADGLALECVCLCGITATPPSPEIHKTALGAEDSVDWRHYPDTLEAMADLRRRGYTLCCLEQVEGSIMLDQWHPDPDGRYAIIVGNEVDGVAQQVVDAADLCLEIPQYGTKHSLNVSISAAIALWQTFTHLPRPTR